MSKRIPVKTEIGSPLGPLENLLQTKKGRTSLDDCLDCASKDLLLAAQIRSEKPNSFLALCDLSYVAGYLKQAMAATSQGGGCLAVDMSQEKKIFDYTKEAAKNLGINLTMAVMLLAPATVTLNGLHGKDSLFMHQPDGLSPLTEQKIVFRAAKGGKQ